MLLSIVGMRFRPPAQAIVSALPGGTRLVLRPEPSNAFDPNALQVLVKSEDISSSSALEAALAGYGFELTQLWQEPEWHLGYVKATQAASLALLGDTEASLAFDAGGWPHASLEAK